MSATFSINDFELGGLYRPYIIAEIGVNHEGSMDTAKRQIEDAAAGGAHAAKFQSYKADKIAIVDSPAYWDTGEEPTATGGCFSETLGIGFGGGMSQPSLGAISARGTTGSAGTGTRWVGAVSAGMSKSIGWVEAAS